MNSNKYITILLLLLLLLYILVYTEAMLISKIKNNSIINTLL
jgi:hypothetical protein